MTKRIIQNELRCKSCGDVIFSRHRHDFVRCSCGQCAVDGGMDYLRRVGDGDWEDRSMRMEQQALQDAQDAVQWADETGRNELGTVLAVIRALRKHGLLNTKEFY